MISFTNPNTKNILNEILNLQPGDSMSISSGTIYCHLGSSGRYIDIYDNSDEFLSSLLIYRYEDIEDLMPNLIEVFI